MAIRMSGLSSGLDTDAIVSALVSGYSYKKEKYQKAQTKLSWKQDSWKSLNTKIYSLYSNVSNLRFSSAYTLKKTSVSDTTKATVTASNTAPNGTQKLNVINTANAGSLTGAKLDDASSGSSTLAELGYAGGEAKVTVQMNDGTSKEVSFDGTTTLDSIATQFKEAGLNASYDATNKRFYISAKKTGVDNDFSLVAGNSDGADALYKLGISVDNAATSNAYSNYASLQGASDSATVTNITNAVTSYKNAQNTVNSNTEANANMVAAMTYGKAYSSVQDMYSTKGVSAADQQQLERLAALGSSGRNNSISYSGNTYTKTSTQDTDGNNIYAYKDDDGNQHYISEKITYTNNGKEYKKNENGEYVNVADETDIYSENTADLTEKKTYYITNEVETYKDGDGKEYSVVKNGDGTETYTELNPEAGQTAKVYTKGTDGKFYEGSTATGDTTDISIEAKYSYEASTTSVTASSSSDDYTALLEKYSITESEASTYASNVSKVNSFEAKTNTYLQSSDSASIESLTADIKTAYANGGAEEVKTLTSGYSATITANKTAISTAEETMSDNSVVADLAKMDTSTTEGQEKYDAAVNRMVEKVNAASEVVSAGVQVNAGANKVAGSNALIKLNGVEYEGESNDFTINGLTISALQATGDGDENAISITTSTDVQGIYDKIKDFLTEYNNLINEITSLYNAASSKGYDPLSDDEKDEMSDKEIEKWEQKIKDSLLRGDDTLSGVMTAMSSAMSKSIEIDGKKYSLSSFGIHTMGYLNSAENEQNAYHIDGDEDDANTASNADKLMAAITNDPDTIVEFMQTLTTNLYSAIGNKMSSSTLSSAFTVYNDKQMSSQYNQYTDLIKQWEERISTKEEYYYSKFTSMESALAKLNSTQSSLSGYFN